MTESQPIPGVSLVDAKQLYFNENLWNFNDVYKSTFHINKKICVSGVQSIKVVWSSNFSSCFLLRSWFSFTESTYILVISFSTQLFHTNCWLVSLVIMLNRFTITYWPRSTLSVNKNVQTRGYFLQFLKFFFFAS